MGSGRTGWRSKAEAVKRVGIRYLYKRGILSYVERLLGCLGRIIKISSFTTHELCDSELESPGHYRDLLLPLLLTITPVIKQ